MLLKNTEKMKSISFKNFRRFASFPEFRFGEITILVGTNNAGKSTFAKAIDFIVYNLKDMVVDDIELKSYFKLDILGNFRRVKNNATIEPIEFELKFGEGERFVINICLGETDLNSQFLEVRSIRVFDRKEALRYVVELGEDRLTEARVEDAAGEEIPTEQGNDTAAHSALVAYLQKVLGSAKTVESLQALDKAICNMESLQLPIHSLDRKVVFTQTHPLYPLIFKFINSQFRAEKNEKFIEVMRFFGIADDYRIEEIGGEAYTFEVMQNGNWIHLADIGTGAMRLIEISLFIINARRGSIVFLEEPEQNLHPKLQSQLAPFFMKVNQDLGVKIIAETHSEYLIRQSQVEVARIGAMSDDFEIANPFKVYYFPEDGMPYDMVYRPNGKFVNAFGPGFFNVADDAALELFDLENPE